MNKNTQPETSIPPSSPSQLSPTVFKSDSINSTSLILIYARGAADNKIEIVKEEPSKDLSILSSFEMTTNGGYEYTLSDNKKILLAYSRNEYRSPNELIIIDLISGATQKILSDSDERIESAIFSKDDKKIIISNFVKSDFKRNIRSIGLDGKIISKQNIDYDPNIPNESDYSIQLVKELNSGRLIANSFGAEWMSSLLEIANGEKRIIKEVTIRNPEGVFGLKRDIFSDTTKETEDECNYMTLFGSSEIGFFDLNNKPVGYVGVPNRLIYGIVSFSPDDKKVMFASPKRTKNYSCEIPDDYEYFVQSIQINSAKAQDVDPMKIIAEWKTPLLDNRPVWSLLKSKTNIEGISIISAY